MKSTLVVTYICPSCKVPLDATNGFTPDMKVEADDIFICSCDAVCIFKSVAGNSQQRRRKALHLRILLPKELAKMTNEEREGIELAIRKITAVKERNHQ